MTSSTRSVGESSAFVFYQSQIVRIMAMQMPSTKPTAKYYAFCVAFTSIVGTFFAARLPELISMSIVNPVQGMTVAVALVAILSLFLVPPSLVSTLIRRLGLIGIVLYSLKTEMDPNIKNLSVIRDLTGSICIVTGANSGTGYSITQLLVERGATVVMACRSVKKCAHAAKLIEGVMTLGKRRLVDTTGTLDVMQMDLADLKSVRAFTSEFTSKYSRVDVLINNAGVIAPAGLKTVQGFEISFGAMHIGHFALTKWLMPLLLKPLPTNENGDSDMQPIPHPFQNGARVVNVGSQAYSFGLFDASLMEGSTGFGDISGELTDNCANFGPFNMFNCCPLFKCPVTNGYARAKLANVLHVHELQRRSDLEALELVRIGSAAPRRLVSSVLHPGTVSTGIHWSMHTLSKLMRTGEQAAHIILHAIQGDTFLPGSYIDCMGQSHDLQDYRKLHLSVHLKAFSNIEVAHLPFVHKPAIDKFSFEVWNFKGRALLGSISGKVPYVPSSSVAARLWDISERILADWEADGNTL